MPSFCRLGPAACCAATVLAALVLCTHAPAHGEDRLWVEIPAQGMLTIVDQDAPLFDFAATGLDAQSAPGKRGRSRVNSEMGVYLEPGQALELDFFGDGPAFSRLEFLRNMPAKRLRGLSIMTDRLECRRWGEIKSLADVQDLMLHCGEIDDLPTLVRTCPELRSAFLSTLDFVGPNTADPEQADRDPLRDDTCAQFAGWKHLRYVHVSGHKLSEGALQHLVTLPKIEGISIWFPAGITDDGLRSFRTAESLKMVSFKAGPKCTAEGFLSLAECPNLVRIYIHTDEDAHREMIASLQKRMPHARVKIVPSSPAEEFTP
jgi:hypothetical protein